MRTCVGCGTRARRDSLIRLVLVPPGVLQVDPDRQRPGRGTWVHADAVCISRARQRRGFQRSLRMAPIIEDSVWDQLGDLAQEATHDASTNRVMEAGWKPMGTR
ncbi:YlxR family protein [Schaalia sp. ZJ405]|uniref:YlxR family protein n=1 Tax=Schaalia sp. ZJ405 TaxID=2709403 RepID=UPI0013EDAED0